MKKYKVPYTGFVVVIASSAEEAIDAADNDGEIYEEWEWGDPILMEDDIEEPM